MNVKKLLGISLAGLFVIPALASAYEYDPQDYGRVRETLVEGHTVFAVIQATICLENHDDPDNASKRKCPDDRTEFDVSWDVRANVTVQRMGTAVAVLVRDRVKPYVPPPTSECSANRDVVASVFYENPAVLWFNDQFLVGDDLDLVETEIDANVDVCAKKVTFNGDFSALDWRYPCGGWVLATQAGNPDPRDVLSAWKYAESYRIEDPNGYVWIIDKYSLLPVSVPLPAEAYQDVSQDVAHMEDRDLHPQLDEKGTGFTITGDEDGNGTGPNATYDGDEDLDGEVRVITGTLGNSTTFHLGAYNMWAVPVLGADAADENGPGGAGCNPYVDTASHRGSPNPLYDDADPTDYDARLYNAVLFFFFGDLGRPTGLKVHGEGSGAKNVTGCEAGTEWECGEDIDGEHGPYDPDDEEGNSHPFNPQDADNTSGPKHVHPTAAVDLYYTNVAPPSVAAADRVYAIFDTVGSSAPFHGHTSAATFDDRLRFDACADADTHQYESQYTYNTTSDDWDSTTTGGTTEQARLGDGETGTDGVNGDDCTSSYYGSTTGWHPTGTVYGYDEGTVPDEEYY